MNLQNRTDFKNICFSQLFVLNILLLIIIYTFECLFMIDDICSLRIFFLVHSYGYSHSHR